MVQESFSAHLNENGIDNETILRNNSAMGGKEINQYLTQVDLSGFDAEYLNIVDQIEKFPLRDNTGTPAQVIDITKLSGEKLNHLIAVNNQVLALVEKVIGQLPKEVKDLVNVICVTAEKNGKSEWTKNALRSVLFLRLVMSHLQNLIVSLNEGGQRPQATAIAQFCQSLLISAANSVSEASIRNKALSGIDSEAIKGAYLDAYKKAKEKFDAIVETAMGEAAPATTT